MPPKATFFGKIWPDGFEFPACVACNDRSRLQDQYFAWHIRMFGWPEELVAADEANTDALSAGVRNNQRHMIPEEPSWSDELDWLANNKLLGTSYRGVTIGRQSIVSIEATLRKIAVALFYKHVGRALPASGAVGAKAKLNLMLQPDQPLIEVMRVMRFPAVPRRGADDFTGQFIYTHDYNEEQGLFGVSAKFGDAVMGLAACAERPNELTLEEVFPLYSPEGLLLKERLPET